ncbi:hypothetical protein IFM89_007244 [Coptis chinensis]|uniref:ZF-HD dimerization-type domain-containing protein n=1 Tax=Coptis chinensis TaxID=261450 RepID=A0A835MD85_9MAGN|nr:hypothetical protein IFM89_007244 [Coptis chinensis]
MDLRGQDHKRIVMPSSFVYNPPIREPNSNKVSTAASIFSTTGDRRRDVSSGNGTAILSHPQVLDHHHQQHHQVHHQQNQQQSPVQVQVQAQAQAHPQSQQQQPAAPAPPLPQLNQGLKVLDPEPEPDPDPIPVVPVSIAVAGVIHAPIGAGSIPRTPTTRIELSTTRYRECLKNHAASIGGHVVDGCGEFMPGGEEGTQEALKCAACECHRNFHRKEIEGEPHSGANYYYCYNPSSKANGSRSRIIPPALPPPSQPPQPIQHHPSRYPIGLPNSPPSGPIQPMMMAFGGGGGGSAATDSSSEEHNVYHNGGPGSAPQPAQYGSSLSKKRFRTKFSKEQKDKMLDFAEKVGWRMQKQDDQAVQQFCAEVGIRRQVLKVWMHNNKHSMKKKEL